MLQQELILQNFEKFTNVLNEIGVDTESLYTVLNADLIKAPANISNKHYGAFEGGLIDFSMKTTNYAIKANNAFPESMRVNKQSLMKVCMLHMISLSRSLKFNESAWHRTNLGKIYEFRDDLVAMSVGERSIKIITDSGNKLTDEEYQAILNFNKENDDQSRYFTDRLGVLLKIGIQLAIEEGKELLKTGSDKSE